jgi:hypothetical protein
VKSVLGTFARLAALTIGSSCVALQACEGSAPQDTHIALPTNWVDPCGASSQQALSWEQAIALSGPRVMLGEMDGHCEGKLDWKEPTKEAEPAVSRTTTMQVDVELDRQSARLLHHEREDTFESCADQLTIDAKVHLRSDDGAFDASGDTTLLYKPRSSTMPSLALNVPAAQMKSSLELLKSLNDTALFTFRLDGATPNCAGDIYLADLGLGASDDPATRGTVLGRWSGSGCPLHQAPYDVDQPGAAPSLADRVHALWDDRAIAAKWDDGARTTLHVHVVSFNKTACWMAERDAVELRARVRFETEDAVVRAHETEATLVTPIGSGLTFMELHVSESVRCGGSDASWYDLRDCEPGTPGIVSLSVVVDDAVDMDMQRVAGQLLVSYGTDQSTTQTTLGQRLLLGEATASQK